MKQLTPIAVLLVASTALAGPVRYTEVREHSVRRTVQLPGTVESRTKSIVAAEVPGLVIGIDVREGDHVEEGQPLVRLRATYYELQLEEARGRLQEAEARLELAESQLTRARELFGEEVVSQGDLDDAVSEFAAWQGREAASRAEIGRLELNLNRSTIRAPFAGAIVAKLADIGEWVDQGGDVVEMVAVSRLEVHVDVPEHYYGDLRQGVETTVTFEALPDLALRGEVTAVIPRADERARTFPIKVALPNPAHHAAVGMLAAVELPVGEVASGLIVPKDAVVRQGPSQSVFRINSEGRVEPVPVETGQGVGAWIVVRGALSAGDRLVTRGNERMFEGQEVEGTELEYPLP